MKSKIRINQGRIVRTPYQLLILFLVSAAIMLGMAYLSEVPAVIFSIFLSLIPPLAWSSYYLLELDFEKQVYSNILWVMGLQWYSSRFSGKVKSISVEMNGARRGNLSVAGKTRSSRKKPFKTFLELEDGTKIFLLAGTELGSIRKKIAPILTKTGANFIEPSRQSDA